MKDIDNLWWPIFNDFRYSYTDLLPRVVDWCPYNETEILVEIDDGTIYAYDSLDKRIRLYLKNRRSIEEVGEDEWRIDFSRQLRSRMKRRGITSDELADMSGISKVSISKYLNGKSTPSTYKSEKIANILGCYSRDLSSFKKERTD